MKFALCGNGYIGSEFVRVLSTNDHDFHRYGPFKLSILPRQTYTDFRSLHRWIQSESPDLLINCAAFVGVPNVDACEDHKAETLLVNTVLPTIMTNACSLSNMPLMHISTGCLYLGDNGGKGWCETDAPQLSFRTKCGTYTGSKQLAEEIVGQYDKAYLCRIRLPFDNIDNHRNLLTKLQSYPVLSEGVESLSHRRDFVMACLEMFERGVPYGPYNITNPGLAVWRDVCEKINRKLYGGKREFKFMPLEAYDASTRVPRSHNMLSVEKLLAADIKMRPVDEAIDDSLDNWIPMKPQ